MRKRNRATRTAAGALLLFGLRLLVRSGSSGPTRPRDRLRPVAATSRRRAGAAALQDIASTQLVSVGRCRVRRRGAATAEYCFLHERPPFDAGVTSRLAQLQARARTAASKQRSYWASPLLLVRSDDQITVAELLVTPARAAVGHSNATPAAVVMVSCADTDPVGTDPARRCLVVSGYPRLVAKDTAHLMWTAPPSL